VSTARRFRNYVFSALTEARTLALGGIPLGAAEVVMRRVLVSILSAVVLAWCASASADNYTDTITLFKSAGESAAFFDHSYGYAVFPTVGKGGFVVGGAHGEVVSSSTASTWATRP
jgi:hypothetical protein